ncbi:MAG: helix-turn-helix domain-containing protein [Deltaproteobacteria bacterium]
MSNVDSGRRIQAARYRAPASVEDAVEAFWAGRWSLEAEAPHTSRLLADPSVHFVFEDGTGPQVGARVVGVWTRLWERELAGVGRVRGIKLHPGAVRAFTERPAHTLTGLIVPLTELFDDAEALHAELSDVDDDEAAFARIESWLLSHRRADDEAGDAIALVRAICEDPELTSVDQLAQQTGNSVRQLQRLFRTHVGATPKWVIRVNRLQEVALRLERGDDRTLADLAAALGYTDQAHLARDFKAIVGEPPSQFLLSYNSSETHDCPP